MKAFRVLYVNHAEWDNPAIAYAPGTETMSGLTEANSIQAETVKEAVWISCVNFGEPPKPGEQYVVIEDDGPVWFYTVKGI